MRAIVTASLMTNSENTVWEKRGLPFMLAIGVFLLVTIPVGMMRPLWYDELAARCDHAQFGGFGKRCGDGERVGESFEHERHGARAHHLLLSAGVEPHQRRDHQREE